MSENSIGTSPLTALKLTRVLEGKIRSGSLRGFRRNICASLKMPPHQSKERLDQQGLTAMTAMTAMTEKMARHQS